ncbi:MAG: hypothetical protein J6S85_02665 [Methanobrevibacter sp.]|nr:hypothetical protein [Methanobrevibacter sp.]MBO7712442.1 hypothetical protein [Methanobrevibacter sp.]
MTIYELKQNFKEYAGKNPTYSELKAAARETAIDFCYYFNDENYSYGELGEIYDYFYELGKRYGLITEFTENGII